MREARAEGGELDEAYGEGARRDEEQRAEANKPARFGKRERDDDKDEKEGGEEQEVAANEAVAEKIAAEKAAEEEIAGLKRELGESNSKAEAVKGEGATKEGSAARLTETLAEVGRERLRSATYRRLNLALAWFGFGPVVRVRVRASARARLGLG